MIINLKSYICIVRFFNILKWIVMKMRNVIDVFTGEIKSADTSHELVSHAIGSCIVVTAYFPEKATGAMAHIMLPGKAPEKKQADRFKYAEDALNELLKQINVPADQYSNIKICLIGGGNVLKRKDNLICKKNVSSVLEILQNMKLPVSVQRLGGTKRRSVRFDVENAEVYFREDSSKEMLLWRYDLTTPELPDSLKKGSLRK